MKQFRLPDPGEGLTEATIVTWRVAPGDEVKLNDIVVEVETSKSLVELPSPYAGTVAELLVEEGLEVPVGTPIITIDDGSGAEPAAPDAPAEGGRVANLVGYGPREGGSKRRARRGTGSEAASSESVEAAHDHVAAVFDASQPVSWRADEVHPLEPSPGGAAASPLPAPGEATTEPGVASGAVLAKPPVRKLAKDLGVDLSAVVGSGDGGVITRDDVDAAAVAARADQAAPSAESWVAYAPLQGETPSNREPVKGVRKATADAVTASGLGVPHVTEWVSCDVTATMELIDRLRARRDLQGVRINAMVIIAKAVALVLRRNRALNASWDGPAGEIAYHNTVNLGIAAATPRGLLVPNVKAADLLGLRELADRLADLVQTAKAGRTQPADLVGGTFTITNVGVFGVDGGTPILNRGESGILCVGQIARRPWVVGSGAEERIEPRWVTTLAVSFDHRVADGAEGSQFLAEVAQLLADPSLALLLG